MIRIWRSWFGPVVGITSADATVSTWGGLQSAFAGWHMIWRVAGSLRKG
jgi:hypothetical protein